MSQFIHLHLHTQYSILDGAAPIKGVIKRAKELGMSAVAITDHGNMFGAKEFHDTATREGIKPIIGCEVYIVKDRFIKDKIERSGHHLVLLAKDLEGYRNLTKIVSYAWTEGMYHKPRIDKNLLRKYHKGIICTSACIGGEIPKAIMRNDLPAAEKAIQEFKDIFGEDYYLEMQLHKSGDPRIDSKVYDTQVIVNKEIIRLAAKFDVKYIATNDSHFVLAEDYEAHDRLICINMAKFVDEPDRMRYTTQEYMKSFEEMSALFPNHPEALATTLEIADKIETYSLDSKPLMPNFPIPEDFVIDEVEIKATFLKKIADQTVIDEVGSAESIEAYVATHPEWEEKLTIAKQYQYLEHITYEGAHMRYGEVLSDEIIERIKFELMTIEWMGFPGYFLITWDLILAARNMDVSVGPGRGSAAGSVVAYALKITNIDPMAYKLLFERFLNPDRVSLPDVDIDFDEDGRAEVLKYVINKYGSKRVAQIITFGSMAPKMAIRDVARVQRLPLQDSDRLAKLVPDRIDKKKGESNFDAVFRECPELAEERTSSNPLIVDTLKYAVKLEGSIRQTGVHACGVIIGPDDLENFAPISIAKDADLNVVQFDGRQVESVGLIKMDFLGLKTLSIIKDAVANVKHTRGIDLDIDTIPLDDKLTYELYSNGETTGLFQFESAGMKKHLRNLKPNRFEDLIAMNALYRPGPMEKIPNFINRKHGLEDVVYEIDGMEEFLSDTYGITVYQEQVMLLSQKLANFTGGQADTLRKAMGKKDINMLNKLESQFIEGIEKNGHDKTICMKVWSEWAEFAKYAFNKSHATCYAYISYQTAYLKANYPSEFMAALLSRNLSDIKKLSFFMDECKRMGINVLGPDINESIDRFVSDKSGNIRLGLVAIKGVGEAAVQSLVKERNENGKFSDLYDFVERINLQSLNKKNLENLALAGGLDNIAQFDRSRFFGEMDNGGNFIESLIRYGNKIQNEKNNAQQSLFGGGTIGEDIQQPQPPASPEWRKLDMLNKEKEVIGIYLTAHPLDEYSLLIDNFCNLQLSELENLTPKMINRDFIVAGMITEVQHLTTKTGKPFGRMTVEDYNGSAQFMLFGNDYINLRQYLYKEYFILIRGKITTRPYNDTMIETKIISITQLSEAQETMIKEFTITIPISEVTRTVADSIADIVKDNKGQITLKIRVEDRENNISLPLLCRKYRIATINPEILDYCKENNFRYNLG